MCRRALRKPGPVATLLAVAAVTLACSSKDQLGGIDDFETLAVHVYRVRFVAP